MESRVLAADVGQLIQSIDFLWGTTLTKASFPRESALSTVFFSSLAKTLLRPIGLRSDHKKMYICIQHRHKLFRFPERKLVSGCSEYARRATAWDETHFYVDLSARLPLNWNKLYEHYSKGYVVTIIRVAVNANQKFQRAAELPKSKIVYMKMQIAISWNPRNRYFLVGQRALSRRISELHVCQVWKQTVNVPSRRAFKSADEECISAWCISAALKFLSKSIGGTIDLLKSFKAAWFWRFSQAPAIGKSRLTKQVSKIFINVLNRLVSDFDEERREDSVSRYRIMFLQY